jgi:Fe-S oxidoreductase/FAD/FMN-containing dehydrogenase
MIGNNSCGVHSMISGRTSDNLLEMEILTRDGQRMWVGPTSEVDLERIIRQGGRRGEIYARLKSLRDRYADLIRARFPKIPRRVSGYNLDDLLPENGFNVARALAGSEGTCVAILQAKVQLVDWPPYRSLLVLGYPDVFRCGDHIPEIRKHKPIGLEGLDEKLIDFTMHKGIDPHARDWMPEGKGWLLVEFGGRSKNEADAKARKLMARLHAEPDAPSMELFDDPEKEHHLWKIRESGLGATARVPGKPDAWEGWEDSAVAPEKVGDYLRELDKLYKKYEYNVALYGHFGQGCIHVRTPFEFQTAEGTRKFRSFLDEATTLVTSFGGSISGEHGDGQSKAEFLEKMFGPELIEAFREFKSIWDPGWMMNPGKVVDPYRIDENLRLGVNYRPKIPVTYFQYPEDHGSLPYAALRCVGVGECRRKEGGTMCPSYMATHEEMHSTRGRAHLLHEMLTGDVLKDGWQNESVKKALDLCLACKGCKKDCPVNVDMATYKAEFLAHYHEHKPRPITAYTMGLVDQWARIGSSVPGFANFLTQTPGLSGLAKQMGGIAPERQIPKFAPVNFKEWFFGREPKNQGMPRVILWADTFNNYFHPETAVSAVEVLEAAGFEVKVPEEHLCCGRPLYDFGMLDLAKDYLRQVLHVMRDEIRAGTPVIGLEPSCLSVFKDELKNLFPNDLDGQRLTQQCYTLADFLAKKARNFEMPKFPSKALVQEHCHHKSVLKVDSENALIGKMGLERIPMSSGCCGMAGSFGFEADRGKYDVSMRIGEQVLLPAVREADPRTLIIADGFSCRTQIEQGTKRQGMHFAQILHLALRKGGKPSTQKYPEREYLAMRRKLRGRKRGVPLFSALLGIWASIRKLKRRRGARLAEGRLESKPEVHENGKKKIV